MALTPAQDLDVSHDSFDILYRPAAKHAWPHERSLRSFLEILYYVDRHNKAGMQLKINGRQVTPRNWSKFLHLQAAYEYRPHQQGASASVTFGYARRFDEVIEMLQDRKSGKNQIGHECWALQNYKGVFYYHKGRLTMPLVPTAFQKRFDTFNEMPTTAARVGLGVCLIGVCNENYLTQAHNKTGYVSDSSTALRFDGLAQKVSTRMDQHLSAFVHPILAQIIGKVPVFRYCSKQTVQHADGSDEEAEVPVPHQLQQKRARQSSRPSVASHRDGGNFSDGSDGSDDGDDSVTPPPASEPSGLRRSKKQKNKASQAPANSGSARTPAPLPQGGLATLIPNLRVRATDGTVGRIEIRQGDRCKLKLADQRLTHRTYRCADLERTVFDPCTICHQPVPRTCLLGAEVELVSIALVQTHTMTPT